MREKDNGDSDQKSNRHLSESDPSLLDKGRKAVSDGVDKSEQLYSDVVKETTRLIRKHPVEAMAVTFGLGCLVGLVLTRRR